MPNFTTQTLDAGRGTSGESLVTNTPDPWRDFLTSLIVNQSQSAAGKVPEDTLAAISRMTANPNVAAEFFPKMAAPLLEANRVSQDRQTTGLMDIFRKAGGTAASPLRSGAFAQAGRQLAGDFARQDQEVLAKAYNPLVGQLSENMTNAIKAGLAVPEATAASYRNLVPLVNGLQPLATRTQQTGVTQNITAPGGQTSGQQAAQIAPLLANYASLQPTANYWNG